MECGKTGHNPPTVEGNTSYLNVSYGPVLAKSLGTSKMVDLGVLIYHSLQSELQRPRTLISKGGRPALAAVAAAPIRNCGK